MKMIIDGKKVLDSLSGETFDVINPAKPASRESVRKQRQKTSNWRSLPLSRAEGMGWNLSVVKERIFCTVLWKSLNRIRKCSRRPSARKTASRLPRRELRSATSASLSLLSRSTRNIYGTLIPQGTEAGQETTLQLVTREPIGVVAGIIPFNFPLRLIRSSAPALMMGNVRQLYSRPPTTR